MTGGTYPAMAGVLVFRNVVALLHSRATIAIKKACQPWRLRVA